QLCESRDDGDPLLRSRGHVGSLSASLQPEEVTKGPPAPLLGCRPTDDAKQEGLEAGPALKSGSSIHELQVPRLNHVPCLLAVTAAATRAPRRSWRRGVSRVPPPSRSASCALAPFS